ncbi:flagellar hook-basal body complex protein [Thermanaerosceptrum fracticalcis]|uniref:Flagellar hook protein FlgE n=1 Tax=Thermanaerosceptrum fracticalcis TaxID=1712410 RepID=A0A7G6E111_THEFR|nr:flagellar hook protein FlgE [Thermanaerosceptrum fracticalcis]QNB45765.1 flagellar hook-basal body complex protein [Thermanaerosceptrum fracticalcis]
MMRSLFAGVSGLKNHQTRMDVIGNNIANVNTVGFKKSRVTFQDMLSQTLRGASTPQGNRAGTNPMQVGLGMSLASIDVIHTPGSPQSTGKNTDLSIEGEGFFMLSDGQNIYYTRAGNFDFDYNKTFYNTANGMIVQGIMADANGGIDPKGAITDINLASKLSTIPSATTKVEFAKNLDARATAPTSFSSTITVYDSQGNTHTLTAIFTPSGTDNEWNVDVEIDGIIAGPTSTISFNTDGTFNSGTFNATLPLLPGANDLNISLDFSKMTQFAGDFTALAFNQNGYTYGDLQSVSVDTTGTITGSYSNGQSRKLAQVAIATFTNPSGLIKAGNNLFQFSNNSGEPDKGIPGISGRGIIKPETLEMSNVDLSQEFVDMIITQRGFQANSRVITTSDQVLEELVNLRR